MNDVWWTSLDGVRGRQKKKKKNLSPCALFAAHVSYTSIPQNNGGRLHRPNRFIGEKSFRPQTWMNASNVPEVSRVDVLWDAHASDSYWKHIPPRHAGRRRIKDSHGHGDKSLARVQVIGLMIRRLLGRLHKSKLRKGGWGRREADEDTLPPYQNTQGGPSQWQQGLLYSSNTVNVSSEAANTRFQDSLTVHTLFKELWQDSGNITAEKGLKSEVRKLK